MRALLTLPPIRAKSRKIKLAQRASIMRLGTMRSERTEAAIVVQARRELRRGVDVQIETLVAVAAVEGSHVLVAFGHAAQVIFVEELALVALLAETAQPVLADETVEGVVHLVFVGAVVT